MSNEWWVGFLNEERVDKLLAMHLPSEATLPNFDGNLTESGDMLLQISDGARFANLVLIEVR